MKTSAAILVEQKQPLVLDEVDIPALGYGQVLVELKVSRICGSQIGEIDGVKGPDKYLPHLLGHEGGGVVLETGPEVSQVKPGDRVVLHWRPGAGIQAKGPVYGWNGKKVNGGSITTFNRHAVVSENRLTRIPQSVSFDTAALLADTLTTGFGVVVRDARVGIGESVVVIGSGGIGLGVILGAHLAGAHPVIAVDIHDHKLAKAHTFGATHTINSRTEDFTAAAMSILGGKADVVIDGTGNPDIVAAAYGLAVERRGRCVLFGVMPHDRKASINTLPLHFGKTLTGSEGGQSLPALDIPAYLRLFEGRGLDLSGMVSHRGHLADVNDLISKMRSGEVIHAFIDF